MRKCDVRSIEQAFMYLADCQLATVSGMASLKSRSKCEYERQIAIAQSYINWMNDFGVKPSDHDRAHQVRDQYNSDVKKWADQYDVKLKPSE